MATSTAENSLKHEVSPLETRKGAYVRCIALLSIGDVAVIILSQYFAYCIRFHSFFHTGATYPGETISGSATYWSHNFVGLVIMMLLLASNEMYRVKALLQHHQGTVQAIKSCLQWFITFLFISLFLKTEPAISRIYVIYATITMCFSIVIWRNFFCRLIIKSLFLKLLKHRVLMVGWTDRIQRLFDQSEHPERVHQLQISGCIPCPETGFRATPPSEVKRFDNFKDLESVLRLREFDTVMLADSTVDTETIIRIYQTCAREMVDFMAVPNYMQTLLSFLSIENYSGVPVLAQSRRKLDMPLSRIIKRAFDIIGAMIGLVLFSPLMLFFAFQVWKESPGPVIFRQVREGRNGKTFEILKIRSMRLEAESQTGAVWCTPEDARRLKVGSFMRKYNIDELPQFWNVLKGEMSLVGPRPERPEFIADFKYSINHYNIRHTVKPGITGLAQIKGWRGDTDLRARIAHDIEYIERWSIWFDIYICIRTLFATKNAY